MASCKKSSTLAAFGLSTEYRYEAVEETTEAAQLWCDDLLSVCVSSYSVAGSHSMCS